MQIDPASSDDGENIDDDNSNFFGEEGELLREIGELDNSGIVDPFAEMMISNEGSDKGAFGDDGGKGATARSVGVRGIEDRRW